MPQKIVSTIATLGEEGTTILLAELLHDEGVRKAYLGED